MKKRDPIDVLLDERNFETAEAIWRGLNEARTQCQDRFWRSLEKLLRRSVPRGWTVEPKKAPMSANLYHLDLTPSSIGDTYCCIRIQQTSEAEDWRLQWGVGFGNVRGEKPRLPRRGSSVQRLTELREALRNGNFQPGRKQAKTSWWVAKKYREERLGDWNTIQAIAAQARLEPRVASDLVTLLDQTRRQILALNRSLRKS